MNDEPLDRLTHHDTVWSTRPTRSSLPSPLKSPRYTATQVTFGSQAPHALVLKAVPVDTPTNHCPVCSTRPMMSALPSPVTSPTFTSAQVTAGFQASQTDVVKVLLPLDRATYHTPVCSARPTKSVR